MARAREPLITSPTLHDLLRGMLRVVPAERLTATQAMQHAWLAEHPNATKLMPLHPWHHPMYLDVPAIRDGHVVEVDITNWVFRSAPAAEQLLADLLEAFPAPLSPR